jgi:hypothetical protein
MVNELENEQEYFKQKYLKYKQKYLMLKQQLGGLPCSSHCRGGRPHKFNTEGKCKNCGCKKHKEKKEKKENV